MDYYIDIILVAIGLIGTFIVPNFWKNMPRQIVGVVFVCFIIGLAIPIVSYFSGAQPTDTVVGINKTQQIIYGVSSEVPVCVKTIDRTYRWASLRNKTYWVILDPTKPCQ